MLTTTKRAVKGGEFGANGEWYEGGKFINTVPENRKKEGSARKGSGKQEIGPYTWEVAPEGMTSIYRKLAGIHGRVENGVMVIRTNAQILRYTGDTMETVVELAATYNAGQRWKPC